MHHDNHQMKLTAEPFEKAAKREKIIESRLYDEKRRQINVSDHIEFSNTDNPTKKINTESKALYRYELFNEMFSDSPPPPTSVDLQMRSYS